MKFLLLITLLFFTGCVSASYNPETGLVSYIRIGDQELGGVQVILADGSSVSFETQKSDAAILAEIFKIMWPQIEASIGVTHD